MNYEPLYTFAEKHRVPYNELCTALRAALAAPQPEPLGYVSITGHGTYFRITITPELAALEQGGRKMWTPVVAAPPAASAPAVPLTDEQFADIVAEASLEVDLAANPLKLLAFARAVLSAALGPIAANQLCVTKWKDGIDIEVPCGDVDQMFRARDQEIVRCVLEAAAKAFETEVDTWDEMRKRGYSGAIRRKGATAIRALEFTHHE